MCSYLMPLAPYSESAFNTLAPIFFFGSKNPFFKIIYLIMPANITEFLLGERQCSKYFNILIHLIFTITLRDGIVFFVFVFFISLSG